jgi:hypothetical protein
LYQQWKVCSDKLCLHGSIMHSILVIVSAPEIGFF